MFDIIPKSQIAIQATQDAQDAMRGHKVRNPYADRPDAAAEWTLHFDTWTAAYRASREGVPA